MSEAARVLTSIKWIITLPEWSGMFFVLFKVIKLHFCSCFPLCPQQTSSQIVFITRLRLSQAEFMDTGNPGLQSVLTGCPACDIRELLWVKPTQQKAKSEGNICRASHVVVKVIPPHPQTSVPVCKDRRRTYSFQFQKSKQFVSFMLLPFWTNTEAWLAFRLWKLALSL